MLITRYSTDATRAEMRARVIREALPERPAPVEVPKAGPTRATIGPEPIADLARRGLRIPVAGVYASDLYGSFDAERSGGRRHEAIDILAPRHTAVVAVEDGTIERLYTSKAGGLTIYQFDPSSTYVYYYAHLERYADRLKEGDRVKRGDIIGYVGTSGNAPRDTPHLHFAIFKLTPEKKWWEGAPIDPIDVLK